MMYEKVGPIIIIDNLSIRKIKIPIIQTLYAVRISVYNG